MMDAKTKLRVWWIPQVPMKPFYVPVRDFREAILIMDTLALYDDFQYKNNIKPDYCNTGGLQTYDESEHEWVDWYDEETGDSFNEYVEQHQYLRDWES